MSARKLWATNYPRIASDKVRHESKAAAYRHVVDEAGRWLAGAGRSRFMNVYVDERQGRGWELYERLDLDDYVSRP